MALFDLIRKLFGRPPAPSQAAPVNLQTPVVPEKAVEPEVVAEPVAGTPEPEVASETNALAEPVTEPETVPEPEPAPETEVAAEPETPAEPDALQLSAQRRDAFWATVGTVEGDVLTHLISPDLMGGPAWPTTRQAYRVIRRGGSVVIATDGMSDLFDDGGDTNGFNLELFVESGDLPADLAGTPGDVSPLARSWMLELLQNVAGTVAGAGGIERQLERYGVLSMEVPGVSASHAIKDQLPEGFVTADDAIGILIGGPAPDFATLIEDMPLSPVRIVPVVLLTAAELGEIRAGDEETRDGVVKRLAATPTRHRSDLGRPSIV